MLFSTRTITALAALAALSGSTVAQTATCAEVDDSDIDLSASTPADASGLISCTYDGGAGTCIYFAVSLLSLSPGSLC